ncbi:hypothetical protein [Psychrobacter sp. UBA3962]|uniref:hypothetical protein n=1 Tax=Psychrobacter sp. UBA3962 TaxID=1947352 RepID=UPI0025DE9832|nr:hypothetical protein [Psychrobacter sp. UBA3962]
MIDNNEPDSLIVRLVKWLEVNLFDFFKFIEAPVLFIVGLTLTSSMQSLQKIIRQENIPLSTILYNKSFYVLLAFITLYPILTCRHIKKRNSEKLKLKELDHDNNNLNSKLKEKNIIINEVKEYLNEAQEAISDLKIEHLADARNITSRFLAFISSNLKFTVNERISLYMHVEVDNNDNEQEFLHIFGRHSDNIEFKKINRLRFQKDQGVIGKAFIDVEINSQTIYLSGDDSEYLAQTKELGINKEVTRNFNMKSRSFYPYIITENLGTRIGVLLCESTTVDKDFNLEEVNNFLESHEGILIELLKYNHSILKKTIVNEDKL